MRAKWLFGAALALFGAGSIATAQDSTEKKQPPPPPGQNENQTPPAQDNKTPPPAPTDENKTTPPTSDAQRTDHQQADHQRTDQQHQTDRSNYQTPPTTDRGGPPPTPGPDGQRTDIHASGQLNTQSEQAPTHTDRTNVQTSGQFQTGQQTQFDQRGVAVEGQVQTGQVQDTWSWPGRTQVGAQVGQVQQGYTQNGWVQGQQYPSNQYQGWRTQGQYQPGYVQGTWTQQGWVQPGQAQGGWVQGQYQPGYVQGQYQPGYVQGQTQQGYTQGQTQQGYVQGQMPMDQSAGMAQPQNFHRAKQVIGTHVSIEGGVSIGVVEDIVFSDNGAIEFLIIAHDGKLVSVPWTAARFNFEQQQATVAINQEQFRQIPTFTLSNYPTFDPQYRTQIYGYFGNGGWGGFNNRTGYVAPRVERRIERGRR